MTNSYDISSESTKVTDVKGLGSEMNHQSHDSKFKKIIISSEVKYPNIDLTIIFGLKNNAYADYMNFMQFLSTNGKKSFTIEYTHDSGQRFVDVMPKSMPKSQRTQYRTIQENFSFERLTPFYELIEENDITSFVIENDFIEDIKPIIKIKGTSSASTIIKFNSYDSEENIILGITGLPKDNTLLTRLYSSSGLGYRIIDAGDYTYIQSDFDNLYPYSEMKEVVDEFGNVFIKIPKVYMFNNGTERAISKHKVDNNWFLPPVFYGPDGELDYFLYGKYPAFTVGTKLTSNSGVLPTVSQNITTFRTRAKANGLGYQQLDIWAINVIQTLFLVEFATSNSQNVFRGRVDHTERVATGATDYIKQPSGVHKATNQFKYRGIEDVFGHIWQFVDGINFNEADIFICYDPEKYISTSITEDYVLFGQRPMSNGYVKEETFNIDHKGFQFPSVLGASTSTYYADYYYQATGLRIAIFGGRWDYGSAAGLWSWYSSLAASDTSSGVGGRLLKKPL
jgi:hypothetical protein